MTVLPQLERELLAAHDRRRHRRFVVRVDLASVRAGFTIAASVAVVIAVTAVALLSGGRAHHAGSGPRHGIASSGTAVLIRGMRAPAAYSTRTSLYVTSEVSRLSAANVRDEMLRVDPFSGRVLARLKLGTQFDRALLADGALWVTTSERGVTLLWRLDPGSLAVRSRVPLPGSGSAGVPTGSMAVSGGWLWVGTASTIDRVSLSDGRVTRVVGVTPAASGVGVDVASDSSGRTLLLSVEESGANNAGRAHLQLRDPGSGALLAASQTFEGVTRPAIGGILGGYVWVSEPTGLQGYVERVKLRSLGAAGRPGGLDTGRQLPTLVHGSNGITVRILDGILWITENGAGPQRNYCADPITGRRRASLPLGTNALFLTADRNFVYYVPTQTPDRQQVVRAPIDPRCR